MTLSETIETKEFLTNAAQQPNQTDMAFAFSMEAGKLAAGMLGVRSCLVVDVHDPVQARILAQDTHTISRQLRDVYHLRPTVVNYDPDDDSPEKTIAEIDHYADKSSSKDLLIVSGVDTLVNSGSESRQQRAAQSIARLSSNCTGKVLAIQSGEVIENDKRGLWSNFDETYSFKGLIQPTWAERLLIEHLGIEDARSRFIELGLTNQLTYAAIKSIIANSGVTVV